MFLEETREEGEGGGTKKAKCPIFFFRTDRSAAMVLNEGFQNISTSVVAFSSGVCATYLLVLHIAEHNGHFGELSPRIVRLSLYGSKFVVIEAFGFF